MGLELTAEGRGDALRVSPNVYNNAADVEALSRVLREMVVAA